MKEISNIQKIWVDADACPVVIKEILYKAAERKKITTTFIANQTLSLPRSNYIKSFQVNAGFDVADNEIVRRTDKGDLVITSDIPLAADVINKGAISLSPRGELFNKENIQQRLQMRDFLDSLRGSGIQSGGPPPMSQKERQDFANKLDQFLQSLTH